MLSVKHFAFVRRFSGLAKGAISPLAVNRVLTYMSINEWIGCLVGQNLLFEVEPTFDSDPVRRPMFVSEEVNGLLQGPWPTTAAATRCNQLRADLESIVIGDEIGICMRPFEADQARMGLLDPITDGVWDIRSQDPSPGIRILGLFCEIDTFLGLIPASRSVSTNFIQRGPLGNRHSQEWEDIIAETKALWRRLMPMWPPVTGDTPSDYFSEKYHLI
jgi:hypothetical protein